MSVEAKQVYEWVKTGHWSLSEFKDWLAEVEKRCEYCDGTGDVHDQTGEWRGVCVCEAGKALKGNT
jgi:hypothetical protein